MAEAAETPKTVDLSALVDSEATRYNVNAAQMKAVIACESNWQIDAVGDSGHARGLSQINDLYNPTVSPEQAFNPEYAIHFMATEFAAHHESHWSCYRKLYK